MTPTASFAEIRAAYRDLARRYHPDAQGGDGPTMAAVNAAWEVLSDPDRRAAYDRSLAPPATTGAAFVTEHADDTGEGWDDDRWRDEDDGPPFSPSEARAAFGLGCLLGATGIVILLALIALFIYAFLRSPVG